LELSNALQLWLDVILDYTFVIHHRPGILNTIPDTLSRMYAALYPGAWGVSAITSDASSSIVMGEGAATAVSSDSSSTESTAGLNRACPSSASVIITESTAGLNRACSPITVSSAELLAEMEKRNKIIPSDAEKLELVKKAHLFGHFGREAIYKDLMSKGFWWPKMREDIQTELASCDPCTRYTVTKSGFNPASFITSSGPWEHIQLDTSVHLPASPDGFTALLVIICVFTGFVLLCPMKTTSAECVATALWQVFAILGLPKIIQSDNGPEFVNDIMRAFVKLTGIDHRLISPYNPRADGKVERCIGTVSMIIKKLLHGTSIHWPLFVPFAQLSFNSKIASLTGSAPFSLMFGRLLNAMKDYTGSDVQLISLDDWKTHQEKIASLIYPAISDRVRVNKNKMVLSMNKHRRTLLQNAYPNGAVVMLKDQLRSNKFEPKYVGPFTVVRRTRNGNYSLRDATGDLLDRHVPSDQLKLISKKARPSDTADNVYEVKEILDHKGEPGSYQYLVSWKGYSDRTWEPQASFLDDAVVKTYWDAKAQL
jgi:hypothetical protein